MGVGEEMISELTQDEEGQAGRRGGKGRPGGENSTGGGMHGREPHSGEEASGLAARPPTSRGMGTWHCSGSLRPPRGGQT